MSNELERILREYLRWLESLTRPKTVSARRAFIRARLTEWGHPAGWDTITMQRFLIYDARKGKRRPEWTIATYYTHLRDFGRWCDATGVTEGDPTGQVAKSARPSNVPRPLTEDEVRIVLDAATPKQRAWLLLALHAGLRAHEVAKIRGEDITEDFLRVDGKGGKVASLPTHPDLWELAQGYPRRGYWFPSSTHAGHVSAARVSGAIGELFAANGIDGSIHRMRHTFGTRLVRQGVDLRRVQTLMRHSSLATTQGYLEVADAGLRDAIYLLPGRVAP